MERVSTSNQTDQSTCHACPNLNRPDKFEGRAPYDAKLEETFKRRQAIPVQIPQQQAQPQDVATEQGTAAVIIEPEEQDQLQAQELPQLQQEEKNTL